MVLGAPCSGKTTLVEKIIEEFPLKKVEETITNSEIRCIDLAYESTVETRKLEKHLAASFSIFLRRITDKYEKNNVVDGGLVQSLIFCEYYKTQLGLDVYNLELDSLFKKIIGSYTCVFIDISEERLLRNYIDRKSEKKFIDTNLTWEIVKNFRYEFEKYANKYLKGIIWLNDSYFE